MSVLELTFMGVPAVSLDGQPITFARRGSIGLLAYLALSGRVHARESVVTLLAGDTSEDQARKHLSNVLIDLHQHVGDYIIATRQTLAFDHERPYRLDVEDFERGLQHGLGADQPDDLERALALYRDDFLAGLNLRGAPDFEEWMFAEREELHGKYVLALREQVACSLRHGSWTTGISAARRLIREEPWLEEAHCQLMLMLARSGQRHAALEQYEVCRRVLREELAVDPQPETTALFNRLRASLSRPTHNLPTPGTPLIGRVDALRLLSALMLDPECRLVTIVGLGGSGKTRLAVEAARAFAMPSAPPSEQPFSDGIVFVGLADSVPMARAEESSPAVAEDVLLTALGEALEAPRTSAGCARERVVQHIHDKAMLVVLDNLEPLLAGVGVLSKLLAGAPHVKLLVTSRLPLHVPGECALPMDGVGVPTCADDLELAEASALFLHEARRVRVGFELPAAERPALVELCRTVGGLPLALILAARWTPVLNCSQMLAELARGVDLLATSETDLPARQHSMASVIESALARMPSTEQAFARSLALDQHQPWLSMSTLPPHLLPCVKTLREQALLRVDSAHSSVQLHPLMELYFAAPARSPSMCVA
jgi:DNA-binding SARP family transcriptional activator